MKKFLSVIFPFISVAIFVLAYHIISLKVDSKIVAPQIDSIMKKIGVIVTKENFAQIVFSTLWRAIYGFIISLLLSIVFCIRANLSGVVEKLLYPLTMISRAIPTMSIVLLCLIWLDDKTPIAVSVIIVFPMLYSALLSAIKASDKEMKDVIKVYNVSKSKSFFRYYLPSVFLSVFPQLVTTLSFNVKLTISGEALSNTSISVGNAMKIADFNTDTAQLFAWTIVAVLLGFAVELILKALYKIGERVRYGYRNRKFN